MGRKEDALRLIDEGRPWYLNGYAEILVLAMIPLALILAALFK